MIFTRYYGKNPSTTRAVWSLPVLDHTSLGARKAINDADQR